MTDDRHDGETSGFAARVQGQTPHPAVGGVAINPNDSLRQHFFQLPVAL